MSKVRTVGVRVTRPSGERLTVYVEKAKYDAVGVGGRLDLGKWHGIPIMLRRDVSGWALEKGTPGVDSPADDISLDRLEE